MNIPISLAVKGLVPALLAKPGLRAQFHLMISIVMGQLDTVRTAGKYLIVTDISGSMAQIPSDATESKLDITKAACQAVIDELSPEDELGILAFDTGCYQVSPLTRCDGTGKAVLGDNLWGMTLGGGTAYCPALEQAFAMFSKAGGKKTIIFFTDGETGDDPLPICSKIKEAGINLFVGGIGVKNKYEKLLDGMAGTNFKSLSTAQDVSSFFAGAQAQAALAAVTNAQLKISPVNFVTVTNFELVSRGGKANYLPADGSGSAVAISDIGVGDNYKSYLGLGLTLPTDIKAGRRSFGKIELVGDVPSANIKGQVLASTQIVVQFADQAVNVADEEVKNMISTAATSRELYKAGQATDAATMKKHLDEARKTVAFSSDAIAAALKAQIQKIDDTIRQDPEQAQKEARRATKGFSAADAAAALKNLQKP